MPSGLSSRAGSKKKKLEEAYGGFLQLFEVCFCH